MNRDKAYKILKKHLPLVRMYNGNTGENKIIDAMIEFAGSEIVQMPSVPKKIEH